MVLPESPQHNKLATKKAFFRLCSVALGIIGCGCCRNVFLIIIQCRQLKYFPKTATLSISHEESQNSFCQHHSVSIKLSLVNAQQYTMIVGVSEIVFESTMQLTIYTYTLVIGNFSCPLQ